MSRKPDNEKMSQCCKSSQELKQYLEQKAKNHNNFKIYSHYDRVKNWMAEKSLFLTTGNTWNDLSDRNSFNNESFTHIHFGICFSFSKSENVAMWMLYGGLKRTGIMVDFQRKHINNMLNLTYPIELGCWEDNHFKKLGELMAGEYDIVFSDVLYYAENKESKKYDIKRSDESVYNVEKKCIDEIKLIKKAYPWNYENECRLIFSVSRNLVPKGADTAKIFVGDAFSELQESKRIYESPNFKLKNIFSESKLREKLDWDLCYKCSGPEKK